ncbi:MAG: hypothetical protein WBG43_07835 [Marinifilaceae bacterium]
MVVLQRKRVWKLMLVTVFCISIACVFHLKSNTDTKVYEPKLNTLNDISREENIISGLITQNKQVMDTTIKKDVFIEAKKQFDLAIKGYNFVLSTATDLKNDETSLLKENDTLSSLCDSMYMRRLNFNDLAFVYDQVEKEGMDVLINFNILKNQLGLSNNKKFDIYASFDIVDKNIKKYDKINIAYKNLKNIPNKDKIAYYSQHINSYQVIFICANLEELITIRNFVEKTKDLYSNRKDSKYVKANKSHIQNLTKEYYSIGNRKELCGIYLPKEKKKLSLLENFAFKINR